MRGMQAAKVDEWNEVEIPIFVSLPELPDLIEGSEDWDSPTREVALFARPGRDSGVFSRAEPQASILDAAVLVTELGRRHATLHTRARNLETLGAMTDDRAMRVAWGTLAARYAELGRLLDALRALGEGATVRGALELYIPSHPLAAYVDGVYSYAEQLLAAFGKLAFQLSASRPDWSSFHERVAEARSWLVPELVDEVRADLALLALQVGDKPVAEVARRLRHTALVVDDLEAMLASWLGE